MKLQFKSIKSIVTNSQRWCGHHPEPPVLESEVQWALGSTALNKASGCDGIPVELLKTLKDDAIKVLHPIC